jgi:hypothetical protein
MTWSAYYVAQGLSTDRQATTEQTIMEFRFPAGAVKYTAATIAAANPAAMMAISPQLSLPMWLDFRVVKTLSAAFIQIKFFSLFSRLNSI